MSETKGWQVWQDADVAMRFAEGRRGGIPGVAQQFETLLRLLRHVPARPLRVLDVGCGDGAVAAVVLDAYPDAQVVAVDGSAAMLAAARRRFAAHVDRGQVRLVEGDFNDPRWTAALTAGAFDAVVSGFAIHHSEDTLKQRIYGDIFRLLAPGGVFVNIEHVASDAFGDTFWQELYGEHISAHLERQGEHLTPQQVIEQANASGEQDANRLAPVEAQVAWLRELGFERVDCYWKWSQLAVFGGYKPA